MSGAEAITAIQLIDACIGITKTIRDIGRAVNDAKGLPPRLRELFEKLPIIEDLLDRARDSCEEGSVTEQANGNAQPLLKQCETTLGELREIFRKACPKDGDSRGKRIWKGAKTVFFGRDSQVQKLLMIIQDNLKLLEQEQVFVIGDKLDELQELTEAFGDEGSGKYSHSGSGNIIANEGGKNTNYVQGGSTNRQINNPGTYNESATYHNHLPAERPETPAEPSCNVPFPRDPDFIERVALMEQMSNSLSNKGARVALVGLGGVGKSQLAIAYARQSRELFPQKWVIWINASNVARFDESVQKVLDLLQISGRNDPKSKHLQLLNAWLSNRSKGSWLIVLDNVDDATFLREASGNASESQPSHTRFDFFPVCDHGSMIITSRNQEEALKLVYRSEIIKVLPMSECESVELIERKLGPRGDDVRQLAQALEYIPLAMTQAAAHIIEREPRLTVKQYLQELERTDESRKSLLKHQVPILNRYWEASNSVLLTWRISFEHIYRKRKTAAELLSLMSFCDRTAIPEILLHENDTPAEDSEMMRNFEDDIVALRDFYFISTTADPSIWQMHRLVQDATQLWLTERQKFDEMYWLFVHRFDQAMPEENFENWTLCNMLSPHARKMSRLKPSGRHAQLEWSRALCRTGAYAQAQGYIDIALGMTQTSSEITLEHLGALHPDTLTSWAGLAMMYWEQSQFLKAEEIELQVLKGRRAVLGEENADTLHSMTNLALTYLHQERLTEAEELCVQALEGKRKVLGAEDLDTLKSMSDLSSIYLKQGRLRRAEELEKQVSEAYTRVLGAEHPDTLMSLAGLASVYSAQGRWRQSEEVGLRVLEARKRVLGIEHPYTLTSMRDLAIDYIKEGRLEEAEKLQSHVYEARSRMFGASDMNTLKSIRSLAATYSRQGRFVEAELLGLQALETSKRLLGTENPFTLESMSTLAKLYQGQKRWLEAEKLDLQVLTSRRRDLGAAHLDTLRSMTALARTYWEQRRLAEAEELEIQVVETKSNVLGTEHPSTVNSMIDLAATYFEQHKLLQAEDLTTRCLAVQRRIWGEDHPETKNAVHWLATIRRAMGRET